MSTLPYIGQLDRRISIIEDVRTQTTTGEKNTTANAFVSCWAKVDDVSGSEVEDGKVRALNVRRYTIRYNPALVEKQITDLRINDNNTLYNIYSVAFLGRQEYIELKCEKRG